MKKIKMVSKTYGINYAIVDDDDYERISKYNWCINTCGYAIAHDINNKGRNILLHRLILNAKKGECVDHISRNKLDNRKLNLRKCSQAQNTYNSASRGGLSRFKGVTWLSENKCWMAQIIKNGKRFHIGSYKKEEDAAIAYNCSARILFGEFGYQNPIEYIQELL